jgi:hypothetical protein
MAGAGAAGTRAGAAAASAGEAMLASLMKELVFSEWELAPRCCWRSSDQLPATPPAGAVHLASWVHTELRESFLATIAMLPDTRAQIYLRVKVMQTALDRGVQRPLAPTLDLVPEMCAVSEIIFATRWASWG